MIRHGGPTGPAPLGWGDDRYDPGSSAAPEFDETAWWGDCANTFHEEQKQLVYAPRMGLIPNWSCAHPPTFDLDNRAVIDIGGGPCSLLLKCINLGACCDVLDPTPYPQWVSDRYRAHQVTLIAAPGEAEVPSLVGSHDEAWVYNVLQHVTDPERVIANARRWATTVRLFEWIDIPPYEGHPHMLTEARLNDALGAAGFVTQLDEDGAVGRAYYGVFAGQPSESPGRGDDET